MPPDEVPPTAPEVPTPAPVSGEDQTPPAAPAAPPPVTGIVVTGTKTEREIELERQLTERDSKLTAAERRALEAERKAAELERDNEELKKIPSAAPRKKVKKYLLSPILGADEEVEE
jgi:hypothetical protein